MKNSSHLLSIHPSIHSVFQNWFTYQDPPFLYILCNILPNAFLKEDNQPYIHPMFHIILGQLNTNLNNPLYLGKGNPN